ncbi:MAG: SDR family oxidoreductase [Bifidobacteriaceae bacterium]|jgi:NAD(P)-dependent dehydrogenase (short-subunit alcohol dehydrogenase family)|nr:SDR family oxidoreductase [Bifidobacteriaceae bacterium]
MPKQLLDFSGKVALVTGGGTGIGQAIAQAFAGQGAKVVITGRSNADVSLSRIKDDGGEAIFVRGDVGKAADVRAVVAAAVDAYGRLDIAVNNAGTGVVGVPMADQTEEDFDHMIATDLKGVFLCMKYEIPAMLAAGGGSIINVGSVASVIADPGMAIYVAAKHGMVGITKGAALDYAKQNIRVNALLPGFTATPMTQNWLEDPQMVALVSSFNAMGRPARPEEMVGMALLLASPLASFITGGVFAVDAGQTAH